jgi:hypothetical protein
MVTTTWVEYELTKDIGDASSTDESNEGFAEHF